jgi:hypothetical protein
MKTLLIYLVLFALLSGCVPIGIRGTSMPLRGADVGERHIAAAVERVVTPRPNEFGPTKAKPYATQELTSEVRIYSHALLPTPRPNEFSPTKPDD